MATRKRIGVLIVHGIGNQGPNFADELIHDLERRLARKGCGASFVFQPGYWGSVLNDRENRLFERIVARKEDDLDWRGIRRDLVIGAFGDAVAYAGQYRRPSQVYAQVHRKIYKGLHILEDELERDDAPLVILSHSLGCQIVSNYLWDHQQAGDDPPDPATAPSLQEGEGPGDAGAPDYLCGDTPFTRGETLSAWITFGCNLPLFTLAWEEEEIKPVKFPGIRAREAFSRPPPREDLAWTNVYDPDDILGFPLRGINDAYRDAVFEDRAIQTGTVLGAHTGYWTDRDFTELVAKKLARLAEYL